MRLCTIQRFLVLRILFVGLLAPPYFIYIALNMYCDNCNLDIARVQIVISITFDL